MGMLREFEHSAEELFYSRMNGWVGLSYITFYNNKIENQI